jgi:Coenzyme F420-dependent N5,N10-methylene tetrahydromethanopterin reductase and related flavin-dependent oxidoreductases
MKRIGFGLSIPIGLIAIERIINLLNETDKLGYDSFWIHENPAYGDSISIIAILSQLKKNIKLGLGCTSIVTRHPVMIASAAVTLQNLSNGKFILGLGLGGFPWLPLIGFPVHPISETKPLKRIIEAVKIIKALIKGERADLEGTFYKVKGFSLAVKTPHQIPIYTASLSKKTLRYSPAIADGVITSPGVMTPRDLERMLSWVKEGEEKYNRKIDKACYVLTSVSQNEREAFNFVKRDPFFIYQLSEVVSEESLKEYGVNLSKMNEIREAWRKRDIATASRLIEDDMVLALTASGKKEEALNKFL